MLTCANCQLINPPDHNFCQRCGEPLVSREGNKIRQATPRLQVRLMPPASGKLTPTTYLAPFIDSTSSASDQSHVKRGRYQVTTVLNQGCAYVVDTTPTVRSPLQERLNQYAEQLLAQADSPSSPSQSPQINLLKNTPDLPEAAYPYLLLPEAAPPLHDAWQQGDTALLIVSERPALASIVKAFSTAVDPLQHVYWMYQLTELWAALAPIPKWRSSLLLADNLGIDTDQSLRVRQFIEPQPITSKALALTTETEHSTEASELTGQHRQHPQLSDLKAFLQSLLAQPHLGAVDTLRQMRKLVLAVSSAETLSQLSNELADIGKNLLSTPAAITPNAPSTASTTAATTKDLDSKDLDSLPIPITMPPNSKSENNLSQGDMPKEITHETAHETASETPDLVPSSAETAERIKEFTLLQDPLDFSEESLEGDESTMVLPMKLVSLTDAGQTDVGHQRDHNEDCFFIRRQAQKNSDNKGTRTHAHGLYVLCDGMGGHDGGEVASQLAANTLSQYFAQHWPTPAPNDASAALPDEAMIVEAVKLANQAIYEVNEQEQRAGHERMGTTLVVVLLQGTSAVVAHVGDSRLYQHSRRVGLKQMTIDHEVGQREIARGIDPEAAYARPDAYQLTQALGPRESEDLEPSVQYFSLTEDTLLLLCSDGLSDNDLVEDYLESHIDPLLRGEKELETGLDDLVQLSNEVNGHDNITAIAILLKVSPDLEKGKFR